MSVAAHLHLVLGERVAAWRAAGYPIDAYPAVAEILDWATDPESGTLRYLRPPQLRALETYWYLRLVEGTPHVFGLYQRLFPAPADLLDALGVDAAMATPSRCPRPTSPTWPGRSPTRLAPTRSGRSGSSGRWPS